MDANTMQERKDSLEMLMDREGLPDVLKAIAEICAEKAGHVRETWQDEKLAAQWDRAANAIEHVADGEAVRRVWLFA